MLNGFNGALITRIIMLVDVIPFLEERMKFTKFFIAAALFISSVSYERQVLMTANGVDSYWEVSINVTNEAFAAIDDTTKKISYL